MLTKGVIQLLNESKEGSLDDTHTPCLKRRGFLKLAACTLGVFAATPTLAKAAVSKERVLSLYNPNTGETMRLVYWIPGEGYVRESLKELSWTLRDHRNDQVKLFDPHVLDQLFAINLRMDYAKPVHVICGYRSPQTNAMLRRQNRGVAKESYHTKAKALDIRMPGRNVSDLHRAALSLQAGGVGYYPRGNFIHIDTGAVRRWG
ncbi:MAG TPA: DUF882 domain-containing protein [Nevskiales bacterium]|nr:DUF882 domain-containing protein [Nevskiales bacterium]